MWDTFILNPMINALLWLYGLFNNNFFAAIAVFTVILRLATVPTQIRQQRTAAKMQALQPKVQEIQRKYKDNQQKQLEEMRKIGYNPTEQLMGCLPLLVQMPIMIGLYRAILIVLGSTPQALLELTNRVYDSINLAELLPIANKFAWLNLAQPDPYLVMPLLVFATSFVSQRVLTPPKPPADPKSKKKPEDNPMAGVTESMQYTMPIMFGFFALSFPAGLSIYWILTSAIGFFIGLYTRRKMPAKNAPAPASVQTTETPTNTAEETSKNAAKPSKSAARSSKNASKKKSKRKSRR